MTDSIYKRDGTRYHSKKELILAVKEGEIPVLESTSLFNNYGNTPLNQLIPGEYFAVGPDPYKRKWFAQISVMRDGKVRVK